MEPMPWKVKPIIKKLLSYVIGDVKMLMSDKNFNSLSFLFDPPPPSKLSDKKLKSFVMFLSKHIILTTKINKKANLITYIV